jgi:hypothetical protein
VKHPVPRSELVSCAKITTYVSQEGRGLQLTDVALQFAASSLANHVASSLVLNLDVNDRNTGPDKLI